MNPCTHTRPRARWLGLLLWLTLLLSGCASTQIAPPTGAAAAASSPATSDNAVREPLLEPSAIVLKGGPSLGLQPPVDIWERVRRGFAMPDLESELVRDREQWYASRPDYILRMTERSRRYIYHIVEELERRKMPTELALLPFIESAFNPEAVSSAKAAGMWQFMPATGKYFDLKQNLFRDERRDVLESTRAALDYLQKLYDMFGDWHLALAAYNWGEGSVGRALARNKARGLPLSYPELSMPTETRYYVPKLQAIKNIVAQPQLFNVQLPVIQNHPFFRSVPIERDIDVATAVRLAEVRSEDFKALNPQMNRPVILAAGTPQILLPWDNATIFERNLQAHADRPLASWTAWTAPKTMKVEEAAQQVNMPASTLRSANSIPSGMLVKAGSTLLVHRKGELDKDVKESTADNAQLNLTPEVVLRRIHVTARHGDTLAKLASRHAVPAASLATWNRLPVTAALKPGQAVMLYVPSLANAPGPKLPARPQLAAKRADPHKAAQSARKSETVQAKAAPKAKARAQLVASNKAVSTKDKATR